MKKVVNLPKEPDYKFYSLHNRVSNAERTDIFVTTANQTQASLINALMLIAIVFLGATSPFISDLQSLSLGQKIFIFIGWTLTILSAISGFMQIIIDLKFFEKASQLFSNIEQIWSELPDNEKEYSTALDKTREEGEKVVVKSSMVFVYLQGSLLLIALIIFVVIGGVSLFSNKNQGKCVTTTSQPRINQFQRINHIRGCH